MISLFIRALCEGRRPTIYGDGEQTRDFTYVANVVDGVLRGCQAKDAAGEVINVATNGRVSLNQLFASLRDLIGATVEPIYADPRAGDVRDSQADISKAARLARLQATRDVRAGPQKHGRVVSRIDRVRGPRTADLRTRARTITQRDHTARPQQKCYSTAND